jgi:hypothetical protein
LRDGQIPAGQPVDHPASEQPRQRVRQTHRQSQQDKTQKRPELTVEQDRSSPMSVAQIPEDRRRDELAERIRRDQRSDRGVRRVDLTRVKRQQWQNDAETENVNEDDDEDGNELFVNRHKIPAPERPVLNFRASTKANNRPLLRTYKRKIERGITERAV